MEETGEKQYGASSLSSGWTNGLDSETSLFPCHFQTLSFRWGRGNQGTDALLADLGSSLRVGQPRGGSCASWCAPGDPCCSGWGREGVLAATSPRVPSLPPLRPLFTILPFCSWSFSLCVRTGKQEKRACEGEFGALCPHTSSSRAHLALSPGKLSAGEEGKGRVECSQSAGSVGEGQELEERPGHSGSPPQKGSRRPHPSEVTTDTMAQESSTSLEKALESGFGHGTELCGVA